MVPPLELGGSVTAENSKKLSLHTQGNLFRLGD